MQEFLRLALPVVLNYLGIVAMGMVDLFFVGRVSPEATAAVGIGSSAFSWALVVGLGLLTSIDYYVAKAFGEKNEREMRAYFVNIVWLICGVGLVLTVLMEIVAQNLELFGLTDDLVGPTRVYISLIKWSLLPVFINNAFRQYLQSQGKARGAAVLMVVANVLNVIFCYYAVWYPERVGLETVIQDPVAGSAWTTVACRLILAFGMLGIWWAGETWAKVRTWSWSLSWSHMGEMFRLGWPASMQMTLEVGVFCVVTILSGRLDTASAAAHQIALNLASLMFMVPLGLGAATAVLVGQSVGRRDFREATVSGWRGICFALSFMVFSAVVFVLFNRSLVGIYTSDASVLEVGSQLLLVAALFQLFDGAQTITTGALRGLGETRFPAIANLLGHWCFGLPLGTWLCFGLGWGLLGLWFGLCAGLVTVSIALLWKWRQDTRRYVVL